MPFLTATDYSPQIRAEILNIVKNTDEALAQIELAGQAEMESYLNARFDVANIFNKTGLDRNPIVLMYLVDIGLYHLHSSISPRNIPELRGIRYEAAINWLKMVATGKINPDLPILPDDNVEYFFNAGSNDKYSKPW